MRLMSTILLVSLILFVPGAAVSAHGPTLPGPGVRLEVVRQCVRPVLTIRSPGAVGNKYGFEGGRVLKLGSTYHLFTSEMTGDPHWVRMKLAHWTSSDREHWQRIATLFESSGDFTGRDPRAALWSPMPVFDPATNRWNLFYVAYAASPDTSREWLTNHEGRIWRAVSQHAGMGGIDGPWKNMGIVLERGRDSDSWEGLQGTDSFFPYRVKNKWYAFYGSAHTERLPLSLWQVGLASAPGLAGPWSRCTRSSLLWPMAPGLRYTTTTCSTKLDIRYRPTAFTGRRGGISSSRAVTAFGPLRCALLWAWSRKREIPSPFSIQPTKRSPVRVPTGTESI